MPISPLLPKGPVLAVWAICLLLVLLSANEWLPLLPGSEALAAQDPGNAPHLVAMRWHGALPADLHLWGLRLPSVLAWLAAFAVFFAFGKSLFGREHLQVAGFLAATSLGGLGLGKLATGDAWLLLVHGGLYLSALRYIKSPQRPQAFQYLAFLLMGLATEPLSTLICAVLLWLWLWRLHPEGRQAQPLPLLALSLFTGILALLVLPLPADPAGFWLGPANWGRFGAWLGLALLPWVALFPAALWHNLRMWRQREELAVVLLGGLLASLAAASPLFLFASALMMAKQASAYFAGPGYRYADAVKATQVLHVVAAFVLGIFGLIGALSLYQGAGFRSFMLVGGAYWTLGFVATLGLYLPDRRYFMQGLGFGSLLAALFFLLYFARFLLETSE